VHFTVRAAAAVASGNAAGAAGQIPGAGGVATAGASVLGKIVSSGPRLTLSLAGGRIRLVGNSISLPFRCSATCEATAGGTISVRGNARRFRLSGATKLVRSGHTVRLVVHVPRSALSTIRAALHAHHVVTLRLTLRAEDLAGAVRTSTQSVRLSG
jgi:hypothetical protein